MSVCIRNIVRGLMSLWLMTVPARAEDRSTAEIAGRLVEACLIYDEREMKSCIAEFSEIGPFSLRSVMPLLRHADSNVRWQAILAAHAIGDSAPDLQAPLRECVSDRDADVRGAAILALGHLYPSHASTARVADEMRGDPSELVRAHACAVRWAIRRSEPDLNALVVLLGSKDWMVSEAATDHLASIGAPSAQLLIDMAGDASSIGRVGAIRTLGKLGCAATDAVPMLSDFLRQGCDPALASAAGDALVGIGESATEALLQMLASDPSHECRSRVVTVLAAMAPDVCSRPSVIAEMARHLGKVDRSITVKALTSLGRAHGAALDLNTIEKIACCLDDESPDVRAAAAHALGSRTAISESIRGTLDQVAREDRFDYVRRAAGWAPRGGGP